MRGMIGMAAFVALLVIVSLAGDCDRRDALEYAPVRAQIVASAPEWAVRR